MYSRRSGNGSPADLLYGIRIALLAITCLFLGAACNRSRTEIEIVDVQFFHDEICPSCETYQTAMDIGGALTSLSQKRKDLSVEIHNMIDPQTPAVLKEQLELRGLPDVSRSIPILLIDSTYVSGYENILEAVEELR